MSEGQPEREPENAGAAAEPGEDDSPGQEEPHEAQGQGLPVRRGAPMNAWIRKLEEEVEKGDLDVDSLLEHYKKTFARPTWQLVLDIERQAMIHTNIIEQLKDGKPASLIRQTLGEPHERETLAGPSVSLGLVPEEYLPNPNGPLLLTRAFDKVARYRDALVDIVRNHGAALLEELSFEVGRTVTVGVNVGFPPSISLGVEHTAQISTRWA